MPRKGCEWTPRATCFKIHLRSRSDIEYYDNTVLQELAKSAHLVDESIPFDEDMASVPGAQDTLIQPTSDIPHYDNTVIQEYSNTVIQEKVSTQRTGRPGTMREPILNLLREHPGLSAEQIRALLSSQKPIGDTLQGLRRGHFVRTEGSGREMRYFLA
jgi:hypothetical protein